MKKSRPSLSDGFLFAVSTAINCVLNSLCTDIFLGHSGISKAKRRQWGWNSGLSKQQHQQHPKTALKQQQLLKQWMVNYFCDEVSQFWVKSIFDVTRDGSLAPPDVTDHHQDRRPQCHRHHYMMEAESVADVFLQKDVQNLGRVAACYLPIHFPQCNAFFKLLYWFLNQYWMIMQCNVANASITVVRVYVSQGIV